MIDPRWAEEYGLDQQRVLALGWQIPEEIRLAGRSLTSAELAARLDVPVGLVGLVCQALREGGRLVKTGGF
jgi:hypothetical protein